MPDSFGSLSSRGSVKSEHWHSKLMRSGSKRSHKSKTSLTEKQDHQEDRHHVESSHHDHDHSEASSVTSREEDETHAQLEALVTEAKTIDENIERATASSGDLRKRMDTVQAAFDVDLQETTKVAANDMVGLMLALEDLNQLEEERKALVSLCRQQSAGIASRLEVLHVKTEEVVDSADELRSEILKEKLQCETRAQRVSEILQTAHEIREEYEGWKKTEEENLAKAQESIAQSQKRLSEAEHQRDNAQHGRLVRDVLTLGIGELTDWGHYNKTIDDSTKIVAEAEASLATGEKRLFDASDRIDHVNNDLVAFDQLEKRLATEAQSLHDMHDHSEQIRLNTASLVEKPLDLSQFLSALAVNSHGLDVEANAEVFLKSAWSLMQFVESEKRAEGLAITNPETMRRMLGTVATVSVD